MKYVVFYYSQTGQALSVARSICSTIGDVDDTVVYKEIVPIHKYPYPWTHAEFFDVFPECRLGMPPSGIEAINLDDVHDADIVIVAGQSWFLSPSLPLQSFFLDSEIKQYLRGRNVIFINACRNMWLNTLLRVKDYIQEAGSRLVGHIVVQDAAPNLISVITVVRWQLHGKTAPTRFLPAAGIDKETIANTSRFGTIIKDALHSDNLNSLQAKLLAAGGIIYKPSIIFMEKVGYRMFLLWARFVRIKGNYGDKRRRHRLNAFYYYLLFVLFIVSPFAQLFFYITYPLRRVSYHKRKDCSTTIYSEPFR